MGNTYYTVNINSAVGSNIAVGCNGNIAMQNGLSEYAAEAVRIIEKLKCLDKVLAMAYLYALEDGKEVPRVKV